MAAVIDRELSAGRRHVVGVIGEKHLAGVQARLEAAWPTPAPAIAPGDAAALAADATPDLSAVLEEAFEPAPQPAASEVV